MSTADQGYSPTEAELSRFADGLEEHGIFARRYSGEALARLFTAAATLHSHFSNLDLTHLEAAMAAKLIHFVNAWSATQAGMRSFPLDPDQADAPAQKKDPTS